MANFIIELSMASGIVENWIFFGICYSILSGLITIASVSITTIQQQESIVYNIGKILSSFFVIATILHLLEGY